MLPVFLIGYMGCGKTTLGEALAAAMGVRYIDLDECVEARCGQSVVQIFEERGEAGFRELENEALREVASLTNVIVGCGGGTPCHGDNMKLMNKAGTTIWLTTSPQHITSRLLLPEQKAKRPKVLHLPDEDVLPLVKAELLARAPVYAQAQLQFDSTDIETAEETELTARRLATLLTDGELI